MNTQRDVRERDFHDGWASEIDPRTVPVRQTFAASTSPEPRWLLSQLGDLRGKRVLDLGTGAGEAAVYFALQGANVTAVDLSPGMLDVVRCVAKHHGVEVTCEVASAEDLSIFEAASFDVVYAANVLHHVDTDRCLGEVARVLRAGGAAVSWDPIAYNPIINVYRRMATEVRTSDEHPLRRADLELFKKHFRHYSSRFFWFSTLLVFLKFYLIDRVHPNEDRYWKRILTQENELRTSYLFLESIDRGLLKVFPSLRWLCWTVAVVAQK